MTGLLRETTSSRGLGGWFFPDDDRAAFTEGLRRGAFLVSVDVDEPDHDTALDILDAEGSIDLDERADLWRTEGWDLQSSRPADPGSIASQNDYRKGRQSKPMRPAKRPLLVIRKERRGPCRRAFAPMVSKGSCSETRNCEMMSCRPAINER